MYRTTSTTIVRFALALVITLGVLAGASSTSYAGGAWPSGTRSAKVTETDAPVGTQPIFVEQLLLMLGAIF